MPRPAPRRNSAQTLRKLSPFWKERTENWQCYTWALSRKGYNYVHTALENLGEGKGRWKLCWKAFVTFENIAWPMTNSSRPFPPIVKEPAVVRLIDCYTMHTTKSDHSGCCYASKKNLYRGPLNHAYLYFLPKFEPTYKVQAVNRRDQTPHGEPPKSQKHHYRYF